MAESSSDRTRIAAEWLAARLGSNDTESVRRAVASLIEEGSIPAGAQLPTIRDLATASGASRRTVGDAWIALRREGLVATHRRGGTRVLPRPGERGPSPFRGWSPVELVHGFPDAAHTPPLSAIIADAVGADASSPDAPITPLLEEASAQTWPFRAERFLAMPSGRAALFAVLEASLASAQGDRESGRESVGIALEQPTLVRTASLVRQLGVRIEPVDVDREGATAGSVAHALERGAGVFVHQPSARIPTGTSLSIARRQELAAVIRAAGGSVWVIEEDPLGPIAPPESLGVLLPDRTVRIRQFWRAYGRDLDVAVVGGARALVDRVHAAQRRTGMRASRLIQDVLARALLDPSVAARVAEATQRYRARYRMLEAALADSGIPVASDGGLFVWIPVADERRAAAQLGDLGIHVERGSPSFAGPTDGGHLRVAVTGVPDDPLLVDELAASIAMAMRVGAH